MVKEVTDNSDNRGNNKRLRCLHAVTLMGVAMVLAMKNIERT